MAQSIYRRSRRHGTADMVSIRSCRAVVGIWSRPNTMVRHCFIGPMSWLTPSVTERLHLHCHNRLVGLVRCDIAVLGFQYILLSFISACRSQQSTKHESGSFMRFTTTQPGHEKSFVIFHRRTAVIANMDHSGWQHWLASFNRPNLAIVKLWQNQSMGQHLVDQHRKLWS